jgi:hypothetical protein
MQCDDLSQSFAKFAPYVTQILSSPVGRCLETARKGFSRHLRSGLKIQVMPALAGTRGDGFSSSTATRHPEVDDVWIQKPTQIRNRRMSPEEFVIQFLKLKNMTVAEAAKVKEVVIVTYGQQLSALLGKGDLKISQPYHQF